MAGALGEFAHSLLLRLYVLLESTLIMRPQIQQLTIYVPEKTGEVFYFEAWRAIDCKLCGSIVLLFCIFLSFFQCGSLVFGYLGLFSWFILADECGWIEFQALEIRLRY